MKALRDTFIKGSICITEKLCVPHLRGQEVEMSPLITGSQMKKILLEKQTPSISASSTKTRYVLSPKRAGGMYY